MESSQEEAETKLESQTEKFNLRQNVFILEHLLEGAELQWKETKNELEGVLTKGKLKGDEKSPEYLASKIELMRDKAKVECLLEKKKSVKDERNLESQRCKKRLSDNMEKAEFILQEMKSMLEEGLEAPGLEMQLEEQIAKSELLLEEMELVGAVEEGAFEELFTDVVVKSPVLKMQLKKHIVKVESLLENMKFVHEESTEDTVELKFLLREMKLAQESGKVKSSSSRSMLEAYVVKLKLLLDETKLEKEKEELGSQMLEIDLLEELIEKRFVLLTNERLQIELKGIFSVRREMKSEHKGKGLKHEVLEVKLEQKEKEEHATTSKSLQEKIELVQEESNIKSPALEMRLKECILKLDGVLKQEKLEFLKERLKFRKLRIQLLGHMAEMEPLLEKMKLKREEEGLRSQALEMELNEDLENLELLLEETKLEERHVAKVKRFIMKARKIKSVREESKTKSATLEMQFDKRREEFWFLFYEMKFLRWSEERWQMQFKMQHEAKLEFLLKGIELKQEEERLPSRELEMELEELELLVKEIESERHVEVPESLALKMQLEGHLGKVKSLLEAMKMEHEKENPELPAMKEQLKERVVRVKDIIFPPSKRSSIKNLTEDIKELESVQQKLILLQFTEEIKSQMLKMELERYTGELESLEEEIELEELRLPMLEFEYSERHGQKWWETHIQKSWEKHQKSSETHIKKSWETHIQKSESLLNKLESECNEKILQPLVWKMILKGHTATQKRKLEFPTLVTEKHIAKLESLMVEMKLEQEEGLEFQMLDIKLKEHVLKSELLVTETKLLCDVYMQQSSVSKMQLEENLAKVKSRLEITKLEREKREAKFIALQTMLKQEKEKLESLTGARKYTPRGQDGLNKLIEPRHIIVIGGRGQYGQSLKAVEGYVFFEGRWIELPAMTTPRSFMSSVVVGQEIIVSGGDTGDAITDTIEVLNLAETPLQWKISPVKLPVPLSAHQTVVYRGKLIVIGGHDGNEGRNSDKIYEILLTPPYSIKILKTWCHQWHGMGQS